MSRSIVALALLTLASCIANHAAPPAPEPQKENAEPAAYRYLDVAKIEIDSVPQSIQKPTPITKHTELEKAITNKEAREAIARQIDFAKEDLLIFRWQGSGTDMLNIKVEKGRQGPIVLIRFAGGITDDIRNHLVLIALAKNASFVYEDPWRE